ncbi:hypothetical protein [Sorangium sp. So ce1000]|uniref:hypothetical protein n=1 Tax=Sorangium sp. So ce1000 TaxID=3133325 RepID=UPI003F6077CF
MLRIREPQMEALGEATRRLFEDELVASLRAEHAALVAALPDATLCAMVRAGIRRAQGRGMTWRYSIALFVELMFVVAPNFDEYPRVRERLENPDADPDTSIDSVIDALTPGEWREVQARSDAQAWGVDPASLPEDWRVPH